MVWLLVPLEPVLSLPEARLVGLGCSELSGTQGTGSEDVRLCLMLRGRGGLLLLLVSSAKTDELVRKGGCAPWGAKHRARTDRGQQQAGAEWGSWGEAPGENGHKHVGRDFLFSACRSDLRNASDWKQTWDQQRESQAGLGESPRKQAGLLEVGHTLGRLGKDSGSRPC